MSSFLLNNITLLFIEFFTCSEQFTAQRKRSWAQSILAGRPALAGYEDLFDPAVYSDLSASEKGAGGQKLLSCVEESSTEIRNNTCVLGMSSFFVHRMPILELVFFLAPEVTEGPYYHNAGHLIRQNIAELQSGLLLVRSSTCHIFSSSQ